MRLWCGIISSGFDVEKEIGVIMEKSNFSLLGIRNYVHSTTMWRYVLSKFTDTVDKNMRLICRNKILSQTDIFINPGNVAKIVDSDADIFLKTTDGNYVISFRANGEEVKNSIPYDEDGLLGDYQLDIEKREIILHNVSSDNLINVVVAANKILLLRTLSNEGMTSWLIGKINLNYSDLEKDLPSGALCLKLNNVLANQYTKVSVYIGDKKYGVLESARKRR